LPRLNTDGTLDTGFKGLDPEGIAADAVNVGGTVNALLLGRDGKVTVAGHGVQRLNADGSPDEAFDYAGVGTCTTEGMSIATMALQRDGKYLLGGHFCDVSGVSRYNIARLTENGRLDLVFQNGMDGLGRPCVPEGICSAIAIAVQDDGQVLVVGEFAIVNGVSRNRIARLNHDGSLDTSFQDGLAGANERVTSIALQRDGKVMIGGWFTTVNGVERGRVARLNVDGTLDENFLNGLSGANSDVYALELQSDGRCLSVESLPWSMESGAMVLRASIRTAASTRAFRMGCWGSTMVSASLWSKGTARC